MDPRKLPEDSILDTDTDEQLIKGLEGYARIAGIGGHPEYIWQSTLDNENVSELDINMVQELMPFKKMGATGAVYVGCHLATLSKKFMALTGLFLRSYVDARYISLSSLLQDLEEGDEIQADILFIANFHPKIKSGDKKQYALPSWKREALLSFMLDCESNGTDLVIGVFNETAAEEHFGAEIAGFIDSNFLEMGCSNE